MLAMPTIKDTIEFAITSYVEPPELTSASPQARIGSVVVAAGDALEPFVEELGPERLQDVQYGVNVLAAVPMRCAREFRHANEQRLLDAIEDDRTDANITSLLATADKGLAERVEENYGFGVEFPNNPGSRVLHIEHSGDFFALQPGHRELLQNHAQSAKTICPFRKFMAPVIITYAQKYAELGVLTDLLRQD